MCSLANVRSHSGCIVHKPTGDVLSKGHNKRVQENSNIKHGETDALENLGRVREGLLRECIMFTTLSPCIMVGWVRRRC